MPQLPIARDKDLIVQDLPDEVLVYDMQTDKAHCLNPTAALIWKNCDGRKSVSEIAGLVEQELKSPVSEEVVTLGLEELAGYRLLKEDTWMPLQRAGLSRRKLIKRLGLTAAITLPMIISITAPRAVEAATADPCTANPRGIGCPCVFNTDCDSANCNAGTCGPEL
jgi:Coenzyme PQQ synthesis protein D (PqqD)